MKEEKKIVVNEANELIGCGIFMLCLGIAGALLTRAFTGFPQFWR